MSSGNVRIYQLAREFDLKNPAVLAACEQLQIAAKSHASTLTPAEADQVRALIARNGRSKPNHASGQDAAQQTQEAMPVAAGNGQAPKPSPKQREPVDFSNPAYYLNRETSWLEFNNRVLHEALDARTPLLERLKFMAIFSSNLDEYFMARIAGLKQQVEAQVSQRTTDGLTPQEQLDEIDRELRPVVTQQHRYFEQELRSLLAAEGICLLDYQDLNPAQQSYLQQYFEEQIFPILTPLAVDPGHPFPYISNLSLNLAVIIKDMKTGEDHFARVKVPNVLPRFIALPMETAPRVPQLRWQGIPLEQVIAHNLESLFPGMSIQEYYPFRITRNTDIELEEDEADDLLLAIEQELLKRRFGSVVRMEVQETMPDSIRSTLMRELGLKDSDVYAVEGLLCLSDLMSLRCLPFPQLKDPDWTPVVPSRLQRLDQQEASGDSRENMFSLLQEGDLIAHHPYDSFSATVQRFITQAAHDPAVVAIKMTLYRTGGSSKVDSPIVSALIEAAQNGKQVAVLVELKARFDEENNIVWARQLEKVGVHVVYGLVGLKTHTKTVLVVRREDNQIRRYVHIGTGNYNPQTARLYTDIGLLSCREELGADLTDLFNYLTGYSRYQEYRKILVAPVNLRERMLDLIHREIVHQQHGGQGRIMAKMNSLIDQALIEALYEASQAGVQIDLIVRGICSLRPGLKGVSENIRVISVIGRFLEHSRIFYFGNQGQEEVFIGSADWRTRNLDRRVEVVVPVEDPAIIRYLKEVLDIMIADNRQAWDLLPDGHYRQRHPGPNEPERGSHAALMELHSSRGFR